MTGNLTNMVDDDGQNRLQRAIEATRLNFGLTQGEVQALVRRASDLGVRGVCVPPQFVAPARSASRRGSTLEFVTVANFPTGDDPLDVVVRQAGDAVRNGADHVDVVVPGSLVAEGEWHALRRFLEAVRASIRDGSDHARMKVILEAAAWNEDRLRSAASVAIEAGADWLKTSTGFHPAGGATIESVALLRALAPDVVGIKASGGIRTREVAVAMLDAGADRIGTSSEMAILTGD